MIVINPIFKEIKGPRTAFSSSINKFQVHAPQYSIGTLTCKYVLWEGGVWSLAAFTIYMSMLWSRQTTANPDKFQSIILSRHRIDEFDISLDGHVITRGNTLKMLGVTLYDKLNFNEHVRNMCQTASCQINALKRISNFLNEQCRMLVYKSFTSANFNYWPIVWLFCGKTNLKKLEKFQERALATVYYDKSLAYEDMLKKSGQLCTRLNLIRLLAIEMFKCMNGLNPLYINNMFSGKDSSYNLQDNSRLMQPKCNTKRYGYKSYKYLGSKVWNCLPPCVKNINDLNLFKKNIYNWCLNGHAKNLLEQLEV